MKRLIINIKNEYELLTFMKNNISYGYMRKDYTICKNDFENINKYNDFFINYRLQTPNELLTNKYGVCWDQVELQRFIFDKIKIKNYVMFMIQKNKNYSTHSYSIIEKNKKFYWLENSWENNAGLHGPFKTIKEISLLIHDKMIEENGVDNGFEYGILLKPQFGINCKNYMNFACKCINSDIRI